MSARNKIHDNACLIVRLAESIIDEQNCPTGDLDMSEELLSLIIDRCSKIQSIVDEELS
jgi:hypothetical protein